MKIGKRTKLYEWQKAIRDDHDVECKRCGKFRPATVDHIIPKFLCEQLGIMDGVYEDERNFQYLCQPCNKFKANRIDISDSKVVELLKEYVNRL